jgi:hypothetical protein
MYKISVYVLDVFKLVIIIVVIIVGCAVFSAFSSFLYGNAVAGIFRLAGCGAGFIVGAPRGWFCVGTLRVCPLAAAGGEPLCKVWFSMLGDISDGDGVCERCVAWLECMAGLAVRLMRCVRV